MTEAVLIADADSTPSIDEEAAALVSGLDEFVGYIAGDGDDIVDLATLLAVGGDPTDDTGTVDSQSEAVGDPEDDEATEEQAKGADKDPEASSPDDDSETEDAADETEGDKDESEEDSTPDVEAKSDDKAVPAESRDIRVLRQSHKFRVAVEPLIKDYADELPGVIGIAAAVRTGKGDDALGAIASYSETAASNIRSHVLETEAESFVAQKLGVTPDALKAMFSEAPDTPEALKAEMEYLSDEARAELEALLRKPAISAERDKAIQAKIDSLNASLIEERRGGVEAAIDWQFNQMVEKAKLTENINVLSQRVLEQARANAVASEAVAKAFNHAEEGRKNDAARSLKVFFKELADIVKAEAAKEHKQPVVAPATPKAPKAPVVKPTPKTATAKANVAASPVAESKRHQNGWSDADFLKFGRAAAKEHGIAWKD